MITAVIFDLDDTLYNEVDYCKSGFDAVARFLSAMPKTPAAEHIFECLWREFAGGNRTRTFNRVLDQIGIASNEELIQELVRVYRNHIPDIKLPRDSRDVLGALGERYALALLTDGFLPAQQLKVRALGIEKHFRHIVYTEQLGRECWKPSPAGFEKLIGLLDTDARRMAYVGDDEKKDFIAPNKLGFLTVQMIRRGGIHRESSTEPWAKARHKIRTLRRLPGLLAGM